MSKKRYYDAAISTSRLFTEDLYATSTKEAVLAKMRVEQIHEYELSSFTKSIQKYGIRYQQTFQRAVNNHSWEGLPEMFAETNKVEDSVVLDFLSSEHSIPVDEITLERASYTTSNRDGIVYSLLYSAYDYQGTLNPLVFKKDDKFYYVSHIDKYNPIEDLGVLTLEYENTTTATLTAVSDVYYRTITELTREFISLTEGIYKYKETTNTKDCIISKTNNVNTLENISDITVENIINSEIELESGVFTNEVDIVYDNTALPVVHKAIYYNPTACYDIQYKINDIYYHKVYFVDLGDLYLYLWSVKTETIVNTTGDGHIENITGPVFYETDTVIGKIQNDYNMPFPEKSIVRIEASPIVTLRDNFFSLNEYETLHKVVPAGDEIRVVNKPAFITSEHYSKAKQIFSMINFPLDSIIDSIHANADVNTLSYAYFMMGFNINDSEEIVSKLLYHSLVHLMDNLNILLEGNYYELKISEGAYNSTIVFSGLTRRNILGSIGAVGSSQKIILGDSVTVRYQYNDNSYEEIHIPYLSSYTSVNVIDTSLNESLGMNSDLFIFPLITDVLKNFRLKDQIQAINISARFVFYSSSIYVQKLKWYETSFFATLLKVIITAVTFIVAGPVAGAITGLMFGLEAIDPELYSQISIALGAVSLVSTLFVNYVSAATLSAFVVKSLPELAIIGSTIGNLSLEKDLNEIEEKNKTMLESYEKQLNALSEQYEKHNKTIEDIKFLSEFMQRNDRVDVNTVSSVGTYHETSLTALFDFDTTIADYYKTDIQSFHYDKFMIKF